MKRALFYVSICMLATACASVPVAGASVPAATVPATTVPATTASAAIAAQMPSAGLDTEAPMLPSPPAGYLMAGTEWSLPYYLLEGGAPGPTVVILGGTHGYEVAGWLAAGELLGYRPSRGRVFVLPRVNYRGVEARDRFVPGDTDLNRCYPGKPDGSPAERIAYAVFSFIEDQGASMVIDLHESIDFYSTNESKLGQTIILYPNDMAGWNALEAMESINQDLADPLEQFSLLQGPIQGSTAWAAGSILGIQAFTLETCLRLPLEKRVSHHVRLAKMLAESAGD